MSVTEDFKKKCAWAAPRLQEEFEFDEESIAAILGNFGHESAGFSKMQEVLGAEAKKKGWKGGYGWAQWTASRRVAFEKYTKSRGLSPDSDEANLGFVIYELQGPEKAAVSAVKKAESLQDKVIAFEKAYERSGVKHYDSRLAWAQRALAAIATVKEVEAETETEEKGTSMIGAFFLARLKAIVAFFLAGLVTLVIQSIEQGTGFSVPMEWSDWLNAIIGGLVTAVGVERVPNKEVVKTKTGTTTRNK